MSKMKIVWIVGCFDKWHGNSWAFQGIFEDQDEADKNAVDLGESAFVGPAIMNQGLPSDWKEWPGGYYPAIEDRKPLPPMEELS